MYRFVAMGRVPAASAVSRVAVCIDAQARVNWIRELHRVIAVVTHLPRLRASQYDHGLEVVKGKDGRSAVSTFETLLSRLDSGLLDRSYSVVETTMDVVNAYANKWFTYQVWPVTSCLCVQLPKRTRSRSFPLQTGASRCSFEFFCSFGAGAVGPRRCPCGGIPR